MVFDIGWRGIMIALVFLADLIVFADLARAEVSGLRTELRARRRAAARTALGGEHASDVAERLAP